MSASTRTPEANSAKRAAILGIVDDWTKPCAMTAKDALAWLEELAFDIEVRIDALREDIGRES